jgi:hypothetical protein
MFGFGKKKDPGMEILKSLQKLPTRQTRKAWLKGKTDQEVRAALPHLPRKQRRLIVRGLVKRGLKKYQEVKA